MSVNKVTLLGHLGNDPDVRKLDNGNTVATFSLATNERWKDKQGDKHEHTEWHRVQCWGKTAELAGEYLSKGRQVYLEGKLKTQSWDDKKHPGVKRYATDVVCSQLTFLGKSDGGGDRPPHPAEQTTQQAGPPVNEDEIAL